MVGLTEAAGAKGPLAADLAAGVNTLSRTQTITFTRYNKVVLPLDGFVFWVKADLLTPSARINSSPINLTFINQLTHVTVPAETIDVQGSLHYSTEVDQNQDSNVAYNTVVFTALERVDDFEEQNSQTLFIANYDGMKFAFNSRGKLYEQADLYHYVGIALSATFMSQIVDNIAALDTSALIVSNSLSLWLAMPRYTPPYPGFTCQIPLYPSFLAPDNLSAPYGAVHIDPYKTEALALSPKYNAVYGRDQLSRDSVEVTLYGCNNIAVSNFMDFVLQYSYDHNNLGIMNMPTIRDDKKTASEFNIIAQKKTIVFEVSYLQSAVRNIARALIEKTLVSVTGQDFAVRQGTPYTTPPYDNGYQPT